MKIVRLAALACVVAIALASVPSAPAATSPRSAPIGAILQATRDKGAVDTASEGTTIYDGDSLTTEGTNTLLVRLGGPQMFLTPNSGVIVHGIANGFSANLTSGTVAASAARGQTFQLLADGLTVQPLDAVPTVARMTLLNATQVELTSQKGVLKVSMGDETDTVEEGKSYRFEIEPEPAPSSAQGSSGAIPTARNRFKRVAIIVLAGVTAIVVWRALVSPSAPGN